MQLGADVNAGDAAGRRPLHRAAQQGHVEVGHLTLVQQGADVNAEDNDGDRPLHEAALTGHVEAVATLGSSERT